MPSQQDVAKVEIGLRAGVKARVRAAHVLGYQTHAAAVDNFSAWLVLRKSTWLGLGAAETPRLFLIDSASRTLKAFKDRGEREVDFALPWSAIASVRASPCWLLY